MTESDKFLADVAESDYSTQRLLEDLWVICAALHPDEPGGMAVGMSTRHAGWVHVSNLHRCKARLKAILEGKGLT